MAATRTPLVSRPSIEASPVRRAASQASAISAIVGAVSTGDSGSAYTDTPRSVTPAVTPASSPGSTRLATTATTSHPAARIAATPTSAAARTSVAARSWPETTHTTGRPRFAATRALSASSRAAPASVKSLPTTKTLSQRAASARNRSTISDIALSSSARTSAYGTPRHASYGSGCGRRGRRRAMEGWDPSTAETPGRKPPSRSTRRTSRSNSPSETAALPVAGSQLVTYNPSDTRAPPCQAATALAVGDPIRDRALGTSCRAHRAIRNRSVTGVRYTPVFCSATVLIRAQVRWPPGRTGHDELLDHHGHPPPGWPDPLSSPAPGAAWAGDRAS